MIWSLFLSYQTVTAQSGPDYRRLDTLVGQILDDSLTPGISLVVFDDQQILHQVHQGVRNLKTQNPVGPKTVFEADIFEIFRNSLHCINFKKLF